MKIRLGLFAIVFAMVFISSCRKVPVTKGIITVKNHMNDLVVGAKVILSQDEIPGSSQTNIISVQYTDNQGTTEHVLEREAMMKINAYLIEGNDTLLSGQSVILLESGKDTYKNVLVTTH